MVIGSVVVDICIICVRNSWICASKRRRIVSVDIAYRLKITFIIHDLKLDMRPLVCDYL